MEVKFYICEQCGNIIAMAKNSGVPVVCCSRKMTEISSDDAATHQIHAMDVKFYCCEDCDNMVILLKDGGVSMKCCGQPMIEFLPGSGNAAPEKHLPVLQIDGSHAIVTAGAEEHPMSGEHFIEWIALKTRQSLQCKPLSPDQSARASFQLSQGDTVEAVYAFCNLHGLWKLQI